MRVISACLLISQGSFSDDGELVIAREAFPTGADWRYSADSRPVRELSPARDQKFAPG